MSLLDMQQIVVRHRNAVAVVFALGVGVLAGTFAFFDESATFVLLVFAFIISPAPVCLIASRRWVWLSVLPVVITQITLLTSSCLYALRPDGTGVQTYLQTRVYPQLLFWVLWWLPALIFASASYVAKSPKALHMSRV
jgi:hypothetical protein